MILLKVRDHKVKYLPISLVVFSRLVAEIQYGSEMRCGIHTQYFPPAHSPELYPNEYINSALGGLKLFRRRLAYVVLNI